ncbi:hypothetical protein NliqN6_3087 [Naganishia liquefaciens]|uniref:Uncharacterized protein n=1 Tax=Naganishia liquefaciens TaxID=104408 RepID=A0A8H3TU28_9TREE|nr:hypothetical protein NliqN6_3087 [Naganishia liquefaciens]
MSTDTAPKRRLLRPINSLPLNASAHTTEAHNARQGVKDDVSMSLMNVGWRVRKNVTEGYKTGPSPAVPTPPRLPHALSSYSTGSGTLGTSYSSSDAGSTRSTYTSPAWAMSSSIFLSSADALSAAKTEMEQERYRQQLEREQIAMLNSLKPRRDLMCLADVVDVDANANAMRENLTPSSRLSTSPIEVPRTDNYHLYSASRATPTMAVKEEPYHPERGRKRHTVEEDEGEATEVEDDDADMDADAAAAEHLPSHRPIRPMKRSTAAPTASASKTLAGGSRQRLRPTQSAPVASSSGYLGTIQSSETTEREVVFEGGLSGWVGRTDF